MVMLADAVAFKSRVRLEIATAEEINLAHVPSPYTVSSIEEITIKDVPVSRKLLEVEDIPQFDGRELEMIQEEAQGEGAMMDLLDLMPDQGSQSSQSDQVATLPTAEEPE
nr:hypothetical protein BaRGS_013577 [Batillaria attramentaria]